MNYTETHALNSEDQYPYDEFDDTCTWDPSKGLVNVTTINQVPPNNATQLLAAIAKGPVSVAIEADSEDF
jgi:cathepsin L